MTLTEFGNDEQAALYEEQALAHAREPMPRELEFTLNLMDQVEQRTLAGVVDILRYRAMRGTGYMRSLYDTRGRRDF